MHSKPNFTNAIDLQSRPHLVPQLPLSPQPSHQPSHQPSQRSPLQLPCNPRRRHCQPRLSPRRHPLLHLQARPWCRQWQPTQCHNQHHLSPQSPHRPSPRPCPHPHSLHRSPRLPLLPSLCPPLPTLLQCRSRNQHHPNPHPSLPRPRQHRRPRPPPQPQPHCRKPPVTLTMLLVRRALRRRRVHRPCRRTPCGPSATLRWSSTRSRRASDHVVSW